MTTNQTIDGVPRELLERVATEADHMLGFTYASNSEECRSAVDELRALLDAKPEDYPICDYCGIVPSYHPWHGSGALAGVENPHIHACNECRHLLPAAQRQGEPVAWVDGPNSLDWYEKNIKGLPVGTKLYTEQPAPTYNRKPIVIDDQARTRLTLVAREAAISSAHRYSYMPTTPEDALMWEPHAWVIDAMRMVEQPAPVAVTLQQVLTAYDYAESHPHKHLRGTTNWCAAVAHSLNIK